MYDYNTFMSKYGNQIRYDFARYEYNAIQDHITDVINELITYKNLKIKNYDEVYDFIMFTLLKRYPAQEVMSGRHRLEIKNMVEYFNTKYTKDLVKNIETNPSKKYIYTMLQEIKPVFRSTTDIKGLTNRIYTNLKHLGYKDEDILNKDCDYTMIELLRVNGLGSEYTEEFMDYRKKIEFRVSNIFTRHKLDIIRRNPNNIKYDMSYQFYNSSYHQMNTAFKTALSFYLSGYDIKEANSFEVDTYINDFITKDMIKLNSTVDLRVERYAETKVQTAEEKAYIEQLNKQKAAIWAIVLSSIVLGNIAYKAIWNMPLKGEEPVKPKSSSFQDFKSSIDSIEDKLNEIFYNAEDNTFSIGGK